MWVRALRSRRERVWIAVTLALVFLVALLCADFSLGYSRANMRWEVSHGSISKVTVLGPGDQADSPSGIQEITLVVEGDDRFAISLESALRAELSRRADFTSVRYPDPSGHSAFPVLSVRSKPDGVWLGLLAWETLTVEFSYRTTPATQKEDAGVACEEVPNDGGSAHVTGRVEHELSFFGPISLAAWTNERMKPIVKQIVDDVVKGQRQARGLK